MLQKFRENISGWIAGVIVVLLALTFMLWGVQSYLQGDSEGGSTVATVNGDKISVKQLSMAYKQLLKSHGITNPSTLDPAVKTQVKQMALQSIVNRMALSQAAEKAGFFISVDQAKQVVDAAPAFNVEGQFSRQRLLRYIYSQSLTPSQFFAQVQTSLRNQQVPLGIEGTEFILPTEWQQAYGLFNQQRTFGYFIVPSKQFASKVKVTDQQVQAHYKQNKAQYQTPEQVSISYLLLSSKKVEASVDITPQQVQQYYDAHIANFSTPKKWQVLVVSAPLAAQASAKEAAAARTALNALKSSLPASQDVTAWQQAHPTLTLVASTFNQVEINDSLSQILAPMKVGQVSAPFAVKGHLSMVKVLAITPAKKKPFDGVAKEIKSALQKQAVGAKMAKYNDTLSNLTYTNPNSLQAAAKALNLTVQTTPLITKGSTPKQGVFADPKVLSIAFSADVLGQGNNSHPITLKDGSTLVLRVKQHVAAASLPLAQVKDKITNLLKTQQAERSAGVEAYKIQSRLIKGNDVEVIAKKFKLTWQTAHDATRRSKQPSTGIIQAAFKAKVSGQGKTITAAVQLADGDYVVVKLINFKAGDYKAADSKQLQDFITHFLSFHGRLSYLFYTKGVTSQAKVKIKQAAFAAALQ